ncbi:MAG: hypothetical protein HY291_14920 [Planctomycetes bacterium]|nr:hypothetical protein [Planctomycetota bacterium]
MPLFRETTPDVWSVSPGRHQEVFGLLILCAGIALIGITLHAMLSGLLEFALPLIVGLGLGAVGVEFFLCTDRFVFDRTTKTVFFKRPYRRTVAWDFKSLQKVELVNAPGGNSDAELIFQDGRRAFLARAPKPAMLAQAKRLAEFAGIGLEEK